MKTLLVIREQDYAWAHHDFPDIHPLLLPICNKPFTEFLIDFAILAGSREIRLVSDGPLREVEDYCETGNRWGVAMSYANLQTGDTIETILDKNRRFSESSRVLIISGYIFIRYSKTRDYSNLFQSTQEGIIASCHGGSITLTGAPPSAEKHGANHQLTLEPFDGIHSYYQLCMKTLESGSTHYVLPGYGSESGSYIGINVVLSKSTEISKPISIGNNVQILAGSHIGPGAIIGSNVIIDRESTVTRSIILDNTYIGEHLDINEKIASGNILIDPRSDASIAMEDPHLLTGIKKSVKKNDAFRFLIHAITAVFLILLQSLPFLLLNPLIMLQKKREKTLTPKASEIKSKGTLSTIAAALSIDRFLLLFRVISGELAIIGSIPSTTRSETSSYTGCRPAVFSYAEADDWPVNSGDRIIVERFYAAHSNPVQDIGMTLKALLNRLHEKNTT